MEGLGRSFAHLKRSIDTKEQQVHRKVPLERGPTPNGKSLNSCGFSTVSLSFKQCEKWKRVAQKAWRGCNLGKAQKNKSFFRAGLP